MKKGLLQLGVFLFVLFGASTSLYAKKVEYQLTVYKIIYNGDTLNLGGDVKLSGVMKKHTKRLPIATLNDGTTLHIEMWLTQEGVMMDKFNVFQHKYYVKDGDSWRLMAVTPRLKFLGKHYDRGHYTYRDPRSGETLEVMYQLTVDTYKKKKKKK